MEKLTKEEWIKLFKGDTDSVQMTRDGKKYVVIRDEKLVFHDDGRMQVEAVYELSLCEGDKATCLKKMKTAQAMADYMEGEQFFSDGEIVIDLINEEYETRAQARAWRDCRAVDIAILLQKYADCDTFALVTRYNTGFSRQHPRGIYGIDPSLAAAAWQAAEKTLRRYMKRRYDDAVSKHPLDTLPAFDKLYENILKEGEVLRRKNAQRLRDSISLSDLFSEGKTKYKRPEEELRDLYEAASMLCDVQDTLAETKKNTKMRALDCDLEDAGYEPLKPHLKKVEVVFFTHATVSASLKKVYYFALNDETKQWLSRYQTDYDFPVDGLCDLAFYWEGELMFSSCTHEGKHVDLSKKR